LLIAGGLGLAAGAGFLLFKNMGKKPEEGAVDPAADPAAAGAGGMTPTAGTPGAGGLTPTGTTTPGAPGAGAGAGTGGLPAGAQQVGPYTVIPDPQSGQMMVFETATQQPVGILDAQGNLVPLEGSGGALGPGAGTGDIPTGTSAGTVVPEGAGLTPPGMSTAGVPQAAAGQEQFAAIAKDLFANAGNAGAGSASSDAMAGQTNLAPATGLDAGAASSTTTGVSAPAGLGAGTGTGVGTSTGVGASTGASTGASNVTREQVGAFTLVDDGSGTKLVLETASQKPVAMMDASGTVTPISVDAQGNIKVTGAPLSSAQVSAAIASGGAGLGAGGLGGAGSGAGALTSTIGSLVPGLQ
jgi:hypothetical protein